MSSYSPPKKSKIIGENRTEADKIQKRNILEQKRRIKPGECHKYIRVLIDPEFINGAAGSKVTSALTAMDFKYEVRKQKASRIILWERLNQQFLANSDDKIFLSDKYQLEDNMLLLMFPEDLIEAIQMKTLDQLIQNMKAKFNGINVTLLIYGLKKFCKTNEIQVNRREIEESLAEIQLIHNCCHHLQETPDEVAQTVSQFSKAIAEIPFKKQCFEKFEEADLFLENDNKTCVRIDGSAGFSRLWQQHLTRIPNVTLEVAEAIMSEYPCPKALFEAYERESEPAKLLENIKIRREPNPLTSVRRIGSELSRKIYTFYTSQDPNEVI